MPHQRRPTCSERRRAARCLESLPILLSDLVRHPSHDHPSATIESSTVLLLSQETVDEDTSRVAMQPLETLLRRARISLPRRIRLSLSYR